MYSNLILNPYNLNPAKKLILNTYNLNLRKKMEELTLKKGQISAMYTLLSEKSESKNTNWHFFRIQNKNILKEKAQPIIEMEQLVNSHTESFQKEYGELLKKYAKKDKAKEPIILEKTDFFVRYDITPENIKVVAEESLKLQKGKYKKAFSEFEKAKTEFNKIINETQKVKLHTIKKKDLPSDLDDTTLELIFDLID